MKVTVLREDFPVNSSEWWVLISMTIRLVLRRGPAEYWCYKVSHKMLISMETVILSIFTPALMCFITVQSSHLVYSFKIVLKCAVALQWAERGALLEQWRMRVVIVGQMKPGKGQKMLWELSAWTSLLFLVSSVNSVLITSFTMQCFIVVLLTHVLYSTIAYWQSPWVTILLSYKLYRIMWSDSFIVFFVTVLT